VPRQGCRSSARLHARPAPRAREALGIRRAAALREGERIATPQNLPAQATSFVGRQATLSECVTALAGTRLLTLTGLGGSGKTRLAIELATDSSRRSATACGSWMSHRSPNPSA
jgi:hypothetical protein